MSIQIHYHENWAQIELNRPDRANSYNRSTLNALMRALNEMIEKGIRGLVISSKGDGAFCSGADLDEMAMVDPSSARDLLSQKTFNTIANAPFISIAAIQGPAVAGGFELALACDLRVSSFNAWFSLPEVSLGLIPAAGGCTRLTHLVGQSRAKQMIIAGDRINAQTALNWGIINRLNKDPKTAATEWINQLMSNDPLALQLAKEAINAPSLDKEREFAERLYRQKSTKSR